MFIVLKSDPTARFLYFNIFVSPGYQVSDIYPSHLRIYYQTNLIQARSRAFTVMESPASLLVIIILYTGVSVRVA